MTSLTTEQCHQVIVDVFSDRGGVELLKALAKGDYGSPNPHPNSQEPNLPWCKCQRYRMMALPEENRCCKRFPCITTTDHFKGGGTGPAGPVLAGPLFHGGSNIFPLTKK